MGYKIDRPENKPLSYNDDIRVKQDDLIVFNPSYYSVSTLPVSDRDL